MIIINITCEQITRQYIAYRFRNLASGSVPSIVCFILNQCLTLSPSSQNTINMSVSDSARFYSQHVASIAARFDALCDHFGQCPATCSKALTVRLSYNARHNIPANKQHATHHIPPSLSSPISLDSVISATSFMVRASMKGISYPVSRRNQASRSCSSTSS